MFVLNSVTGKNLKFKVIGALSFQREKATSTAGSRRLRKRTRPPESAPGATARTLVWKAVLGALLNTVIMTFRSPTDHACDGGPLRL